MIRINGRVALYGELWFDEVWDGMSPSPDIMIFRQRSAPLPRGRCPPFYSLTTDLASSADSIQQAFSKTTRYEIRRAETKDGLAFLSLPTPSQRLEEFIQDYARFAKHKSLPPANRRWLNAAANAGRLTLSAAAHGGEILVWHAYVIADSRARLTYSGSFFRELDSTQRALSGRANKWLHWRDILEFKARGLASYDWGGVFEEEAQPGSGVNRFKEQFGGERVRSHNCVVAMTFRGRLYLPLTETVAKVRRWLPS